MWFESVQVYFYWNRIRNKKWTLVNGIPTSCQYYLTNPSRHNENEMFAWGMASHSSLRTVASRVIDMGPRCHTLRPSWSHKWSMRLRSALLDSQSFLRKPEVSMNRRTAWPWWGVALSSWRCQAICRDANNCAAHGSKWFERTCM